MVAAVVPIHNEEHRLGPLVASLNRSKIDLLIPVFNGCTDLSVEIFQNLAGKPLKPLLYQQSLGVDVPRAIGAREAVRLGSTGVVFIDGDMEGLSHEHIDRLVDSISTSEMDMALTDCYKNYFNWGQLAQLVLYFRRKLNQQLGLFHLINEASPSHGPHAVSRKFLQRIPLSELAIPPVSLATAKRFNLQIGIAAEIPHNLLGSCFRGEQHAQKMAETIIGDCIEAIERYTGLPRTRSYLGNLFIGYHAERDFDALST